MGKVLIATFEDDEETVFEELVFLLKKKSRINLINTISANTPLEYDNLIIDLKYRTVKKDGKNVELTNYEFEIMYLLAQNPGQVFSKEQIYTPIWDAPCYGAEDNVMSLIRRVRKKIEPDPTKPVYILTVWGSGYKFNSEMKRKQAVSVKR